MIAFTREFWIGVALAALVVALTVTPLFLQREASPELQWETNVLGMFDVITPVWTNVHVVSNRFYSLDERLMWPNLTNNPPAIPNSDAQRVINAFVGAGWSPEDAAEAYRVMSEMARERRGNRQPMPGMRTNAPDLKRFPLVEE